MSAQRNLVLSILKSFHEEGILEDMVLIGSWTHLIYAHHFHNPPEIPATRTLDIDFLIPRPSRIKKEVDVSAVLARLDFKVQINFGDGLVKHAHPDLLLEFLVPKQGKGQEGPYKIAKFKTNAVGLRMLDMLAGNILVVPYHGLRVNVPEPAAYALHKFLLQTRRKTAEKKTKDREAAQGIVTFLLKSKSGRESLKAVYDGIHSNWRKDLLDIVVKAAPELHRFLTEG